MDRPTSKDNNSTPITTDTPNPYENNDNISTFRNRTVKQTPQDKNLEHSTGLQIAKKSIYELKIEKVNDQPSHLTTQDHTLESNAQNDPNHIITDRNISLDANNKIETIQASTLSNNIITPDSINSAVPHKLKKTLALYEKKNLSRILNQLIEETKETYPQYAEYINLNTVPSLKNYAASGHLKDAENLFHCLHNVSKKIENEKNITCSIEKHHAFIHSYEVLSNCIKDQFNREVTKECKEELKQLFTHFQNPSEKSAIRVKSQVGLDINVANINGGYEISSKIVGCNDTKIRVFLNQKLSLKLTAGNDAAKGEASLAVGEINGKVFNNIDDFIQFYSDQLLLKIHSPKDSRKHVSFIKQSHKHHKKILTEIPLLEKSLKELELPLMENSQLKYDSQEKINPLNIKRSVSEQLTRVKLYKIANIAQQKTKWSNTFTKKLPILKQLNNHPEWTNDYDNSYFNLSIPNELEHTLTTQLKKHYPAEFQKTENNAIYNGKLMIPLISKRLAVIEDVAHQKHNKGIPLNESSSTLFNELKTFRESATQLIEENYREYKEYCKAVNIIRSTSSDSVDIDKAKVLKTSLEKSRHGKNPADMLKIMTIAHVRLKDIYRRADRALNPSYDQENKQTSELLEEIELDISVPDIHVSEKDREKYLTLKTELHGSIKSSDRIAKLTLGPFQGLVDVRYIKKRNEPNSDTEGDYLSIVLRGSMVGTASLSEDSLLISLKKLIGTLPIPDNITSIALDNPISMDNVLEGSAHYKIELFFIKDDNGAYRLQYKRRLTGLEHSVSAGIKVPVASSISATGKVAVDSSKYHYRGESIGTNTLSYIMTRFNGWKVGKKPEKWKEFIESEENRLSLAKMMINMASDNNNAQHELESSLEKINAYYDNKTDRMTAEELEEADNFLRQHELNTDKDIESQKESARKKLSAYNKTSSNNTNTLKYESIVDQSKKSGKWAKDFNLLNQAYRNYKHSPTLSSKSESPDIVEECIDLFLDSITKLKTHLNDNALSTFELDEKIQEISDYIAIEESRIDHYQTEETQDQINDTIITIKERTADMRTLISQLQSDMDQTKQKLEHSKAKNIPQQIPSSPKTTSNLEKISEKVKQYKTLYSKIKNPKDAEALKRLVKTPEFNNALLSFNQFLSANHEVYLNNANKGFKAINPNKPQPYRSA